MTYPRANPRTYGRTDRHKVVNSYLDYLLPKVLFVSPPIITRRPPLRASMASIKHAERQTTERTKDFILLTIWF